MLFLYLPLWFSRSRSTLPWRVNCWFCNNNFTVKFPERNSWTCPKCEQYNGFTKVRITFYILFLDLYVAWDNTTIYIKFNIHCFHIIMICTWFCRTETTTGPCFPPASKRWDAQRCSTAVHLRTGCVKCVISTSNSRWHSWQTSFQWTRKTMSRKLNHTGKLNFNPRLTI